MVHKTNVGRTRSDTVTWWTRQIVWSGDYNESNYVVCVNESNVYFLEVCPRTPSCHLRRTSHQKIAAYKRVKCTSMTFHPPVISLLRSSGTRVIAAT